MSESKVVVVTGVSSGIGRATAKKFAERGFQVFGKGAQNFHSNSVAGCAIRRDGRPG